MTGSLTLTGLIQIVAQLAIVVLSIMVHEVSHGEMADRLGDPTARRAGRLTLNPAKHLDPFGSILLPLIMAFLQGPVFAYAKPVPYDPSYFRHRRRDELLVAFAGPVANLLLSLVGAAVMSVAALVSQQAPVLVSGRSPVGLASEVLWWSWWVGYQMTWLNLVLFFFNVIPVPPLDGSSIIGALLPERAMGAFYKVKAYSMLILIVVLFVVPTVFHVDPLGAYLSFTAGSVADALTPALTVAPAAAGVVA